MTAKPAPKRAAREIKHLFLPFVEYKLDTRGPGTGEGYLARYGNIDLGKDRIRPGACAKTLREAETARQRLGVPYLWPFLWQHDSDVPQGGFTSAREDEKGLYVEWEWDLDTEEGRRGYSGAKKGYCRGLSIGYDALQADWVNDPVQGAIRELIELRLWEGSQVTFPMNQEAGIDGVKALKDTTGHSGLWVGFSLTTDVGAALALPDGEAADDLHVTLTYMHDASQLPAETVAAVIKNLGDYATAEEPIEAQVSGLGRFAASATSDGKDVLYASIDAPNLPEFRQDLCELLEAAGAPPSQVHGFTPHVTLAYIDPTADLPLQRIGEAPVSFDRLDVRIGDQTFSFPLTGQPDEEAGSEESENGVKEMAYEDIINAIDNALPKDENGWNTYWISKTFPNRVRLHHYEADKWYEAPYTINADGTATVGEMTEMEQEFTPVEKAAMRATYLKHMLGREAKAGRRHSKSDVEALHAIHKQLLTLTPEAEQPKMAKAMADHLAGKNAVPHLKDATDGMGETMAAHPDGMPHLKGHVKDMIALIDPDGDETQQILDLVDKLGADDDTDDAELQAKALQVLSVMQKVNAGADREREAKDLERLAAIFAP